MTHEHIDKIIDIFYEVKIWNNGKFAAAVTEYCNVEGLDAKKVNGKLSLAFEDYLATNITSENAIKFRLKSLIPKEKTS